MVVRLIGQPTPDPNERNFYIALRKVGNDQANRHAHQDQDGQGSSVMGQSNSGGNYNHVPKIKTIRHSSQKCWNWAN